MHYRSTYALTRGRQCPHCIIDPHAFSFIRAVLRMLSFWVRSCWYGGLAKRPPSPNYIFRVLPGQQGWINQVSTRMILSFFLNVTLVHMWWKAERKPTTRQSRIPSGPRSATTSLVCSCCHHNLPSLRHGMKRWMNVGLKLVNQPQRWSNVKPNILCLNLKCHAIGWVDILID